MKISIFYFVCNLNVHLYIHFLIMKLDILMMLRNASWSSLWLCIRQLILLISVMLQYEKAGKKGENT